VIARSKDALENIGRKYPKQVAVLAGDLSDFSLAPKAVDIASREFGRLDGLIVNHGMIDPVTKLKDADVGEWKKLFDTNFLTAVAFVSSERTGFPFLLRHHRSKLRCLSFTSPKDASSSLHLVCPLVQSALGERTVLAKQQ